MQHHHASSRMVVTIDFEFVGIVLYKAVEFT